MANTEKELLEQIVEKVTVAQGKAKDLKEKTTVEIITEISKVIPDIIIEVETLGSALDSADKKKLAVEAVLKWANIKALPDVVERQVIGVIIDCIISLLNKWFGKDWISKVSTVVKGVWGFIKKFFSK